MGVNNDHGYVFINERTGQALRPNTITQEIHLLAKAAGIPAVICPHMFRHRFITKVFVHLFEQYEFDSVDQLRHAVMRTEQLKAQLMQWTGHLGVASLDRYINLAFDEFSGFRPSVSKALHSRELDRLHQTLSNLADELRSGTRAVTPEDIEAIADILASEAKGDRSED